MERQIGSTLILVQQGDITAVDADAVVNAANTQLWMDGGVGGFSLEEAATLMLAEVAGHAHRSGHPGRVILVGFGPDAVRSLEAALGAVER